MKIQSILVAALIILGLLSCAKDEPLLEPLLAESITDELLSARINDEAPYRNYGQFEGHEGKRPGQSPHGSTHVVYANRSLLDVLPIADATAPDGTIIVKENYDSEGRLSNLSVMAKVHGFAPETNDWFWASYAADGSTRAAGNLSGCISCHEGMKNNDYIIIQQLNGEKR